MADKININTAPPKQLTQLPGIAKNIAYRLASHRKRHGDFTHWEELLAVKDFPANSLEAIKGRATLEVPGVRREDFGPRRLKLAHLNRRAKKPRGYTKALRATRSSDRLKRSG